MIVVSDTSPLTKDAWATKCWENYEPGDFAPIYQPCGDATSQTLTLAGGKQVPISLVVIPKQLWTDPPVITWINDRNGNPELEIAQHAAYHVDNTPNGDWKDGPNKNYSCETCGLTEAENFELMRVGYDTLLGNYANKWVAESGATAASPKIDWATSANPLFSYAPPYNTSDTTSRKATAQLGFKSFSASFYEEDPGYLGPIFSPEGSHMEQFDQFGMFHASADLQLMPPATSNGTYDPDEFKAYLEANTQPGALNTWLIEEVDWSGRPCPDADRLGTCNGGSNREDNTVYRPRWDAWLQLLDYVKNYPGGVAMALGEVALAKGFDNAPTVANADQADSDHDGVGDVIDGPALTVPDPVLNRGAAADLTATLRNGNDQPIAGQDVTFSFDAARDGTAETYSGITDSDGVARVSVTPTLAAGEANYSADWDGLRAKSHATGKVRVNVGPKVGADPASQTVQYSDGIGTVTFTATDFVDDLLSAPSAVSRKAPGLEHRSGRSVWPLPAQVVRQTNHRARRGQTHCRTRSEGAGVLCPSWICGHTCAASGPGSWRLEVLRGKGSWPG